MGTSSEKRTAHGKGGGEWLVNVEGDAVVPMTTLEVIDGLRKGRLSEQSLVWRVGMHDWTSISDVPQLRLAAGSRMPPAPAARLTQPPSSAQAEGQRRRITLPLGFPAVKDPAGVSRPATVDEPLAVYDRPSPSLTFSESGRADWQGRIDPVRLTPVPSVTAPLTQHPAPSTVSHSLAPTTAEADAAERARAPDTWGDLDELLANERRADQRNSRRVVFWAALGSATLAAIFALWLLRSPAPQRAESPAQASQAPVLAPTLGAIAAPSASVEPAPTTEPAIPRSLSARFSRHPKRVAPATSVNGAPAASSSDAPTPDAPATGATTDVAVVPLAPLEPAPTSSAAPEAAPAPSLPSAPDDP